MSTPERYSEILEFSVLKKFLSIEKLIEEEISSRGALLEDGYERVGKSWIALLECAVKSKLVSSDSLSPARFGFYSIGHEQGGKWEWSDQDVRSLTIKVINDRFLNPSRRQHALFLSLVNESEDATLEHLYNLIRKTLTNWLEDMTEASHDENIVAHLRRILFRKFKKSIPKENGIVENSSEHHKIIEQLVEIMSREPQDWKPLPLVTARGTPRKAKKGPFTMAAIGKFCEEINSMDPIPSKGQIYEALSVVLPKREGTATHRDETRRTFFKPFDTEINLEDVGTAEAGEFDEVLGRTGAINESEPTTLDTFDMISSSNERALSNAARALLVDLTEGELSIVSSTEHESFGVTINPTIVQELLNKIRNFAEQYWVNERDLLLEAAFLSKESMKNED